MTRPHSPRTTIERRAADLVRQTRRTLAADLRSAREDAGLSQRRLAVASGISASAIRSIERDEAEPSLQVIARLATTLGLSLSARLYPGTGPSIRDHVQAAMIASLLGVLDRRWRCRLEVPVFRPVRGVIDVVLEDVTDGVVACEAHFELRRLEQQIRWAQVKASALGAPHAPGFPGPGAEMRPVGRLLLLRSTVRTRATVAQYADIVSVAYPARAADAYAALTGSAAWPGDALLWCRVEAGQPIVLAHPPRGISIGR